MDYVTKESNALYKLLCKDPVFKAELNDWAEGIAPELSDMTIIGLKKFPLLENTVIYRGIVFDVAIHTTDFSNYQKGLYIEKRLSSWSKNIRIAKRFAKDKYYDTDKFIIISMIATPKDVLADLSRLSNSFIPTKEQEVILKPGTYKIKIIDTDISELVPLKEQYIIKSIFS